MMHIARLRLVNYLAVATLHWRRCSVPLTVFLALHFHSRRMSGERVTVKMALFECSFR